MFLSKEPRSPKKINKTIKLTDSTFFNLLSNKKISNNPNTNKINGILFPEKRIPMPTIHIVSIINRNLILFLFLNIKATKNIEKKEKFLIKPPDINSSPKKPALRKTYEWAWLKPLRPMKLKPKIYWKIMSKDMNIEEKAAETKKYLKFKISDSLKR